MDAFSVTSSPTGTGPLLEFAGALDAISAPQALRSIQAVSLAAGQQLVVDLGGLSFCDSSGISTLIAARNHALAARAGIALAAIPESIARAFRRTGLDQLFPTYPTADQAARAWAGPPSA